VQISLREKLSENPEYLNEYAHYIADKFKLKESEVCSHIINEFEESKTYVRNHLDPKFKNQNMTLPLKTRLKNKATRLKKELTITQALFETTEFSK